MIAAVRASSCRQQTSMHASSAMSLADLADASELSKGHLSSVEHGLASITIQTISRLAKGLGLSPLYILAAPTENEHDQIAELVRKLPLPEVVKLRRELTKAVKDAAKAAKPQTTPAKT